MLVRLAENYWVLGKVIRANRDPSAVREEHLSVLAAIERGDADEAERRMREHIRAGRRAIELQMAEGRFAPQWVTEQ